MKAPYLANRRALDRRHFLKGTGAAFLGLPFLEAMSPAFARTLGGGAEPPKRFVAMCATLGFHAPFLFPENEGIDYAPTPYLDKLKDHRKDFTLFSGLSHPAQQGINGHASELTWLTGGTRPGLAGFKNSISLDQLIAQRVGIETRYPFLSLTTKGSSSLSWSSNGVEIPAESSASRLFQALFIDSKKDEQQQELRNIQRGKSILDTVMGEAGKLERELGAPDREKLDEYLSSVRELEMRLQQSEGWVTRPKPKVDQKVPQDVKDERDVGNRQRLMNDMIVLALQTDSTRTVTFRLSGFNAPPSGIPGVNTDWHNLSHHGKDEEKIAELAKIEALEFEVFNDFLTKLKGVREQGGTLLDHTAVLFGSNLGNASSHDPSNIPLIVAGGGYRHQGYVAHDPKNNTRFSNLLVSLAQRMGVETDQFGAGDALSDSAGVRGLNA